MAKRAKNIDATIRDYVEQLQQRIATLEADAGKLKHVADCVVRPLQGNESVAKREVIWVGNRPVAGKLFVIEE